VITNTMKPRAMSDEIPNDRFEIIPCPVCGSQVFRPFLTVRYGNLKQKKSLDYSSLGITNDTRLFVKRCIECGFVFVNPRIKPEFERMVYNECKRRMYEIKPHLSAVGKSDNIVEARKRKFNYIRPLLATLSQVDLDKDLTLFDYGCGFGYSMSLAREFGIKVFGVDIDKERLSACETLGLQVADPNDFDIKFPDVKADIILLQSNIEHLVDLPATMDYLIQKSNIGAVFYVNGLTPRIISIEKRKGQFVKAHFMEHINFFPIGTLDRFMSAYQFTPIPMKRVSMVQTFRDALRFLGGYMLFHTFGTNFSGHFARMYRYSPEG
jgi:hypothetical protein